MRNLDGVTMFVSSTANDGVVGSDTRLYFMQRGARVAARYAGGRVERGWLVGRWAGTFPDSDTLSVRIHQASTAASLNVWSRNGRMDAFD